tara:strand:- start:147 stop:341 length:195 start_codon:yes stop_codon:yes gene_type:complete
MRLVGAPVAWNRVLPLEEQLDELYSCIAVVRIQDGASGFMMERHRVIRFFLSLQQGAHLSNLQN